MTEPSRFEELSDSDVEGVPLASSSRIFPAAPAQSTNDEIADSSSDRDDADDSFPPVSQLKRDSAASAAAPAGLSSSRNDNEEEDDDDDEQVVFYDTQELRDIIKSASAAKQKGNTEFGQGRWQDALSSYKIGLGDLPIRAATTRISAKGKERAVHDEGGEEADDKDAADEKVEREAVETGKGDQDEQASNQELDEEGEIKELRAALNANCAACLLKLERWKEAVEACDDALDDDPHYIKALSRRATANEAIGGWSNLQSALDDYKLLSTLPIAGLQKSNVDKAMRRLPPLIERQQEKEKEEVLGKLKDLGNTFLGKFGLSTDNFKFQEQPGGGYSMNFVR